MPGSRDDALEMAGRLPLPGSGATAARWAGLAAIAASDLVVGRLAEAHADAIAIMAELGSGAPPAASRWGVWAAETPTGRIEARVVDGRWIVDGAKDWCSGATLLTHALVTAAHGADRLLLNVDLHDAGVRPGPDSWAGEGMRGADTRRVEFAAVPGELVGGPGDYLDRPGFWTGAIGVAACWYGGASAVGTVLRSYVRDRDADAHARAHLGAVDVALSGARDALATAARIVDTDPFGDHRRLARRVRAHVADVSTDVAVRVGRALGPAPYASDAAHARRLADLAVYIRQEHAERDLAALGEDVAQAPWDWCL
jgi:alkylation response protein AidB-like acyl-CoA dehydrogenase